jgi:hypothetical protein
VPNLKNSERGIVTHLVSFNTSKAWQGRSFSSLLAFGLVSHMHITRVYVHCPPRPIVRVGYPEAVESLIRRIAQQRLLVGLHNQYLSQLVRGVSASSASNRTRWTVYSRRDGKTCSWGPTANVKRIRLREMCTSERGLEG